jgi:hypothetical protein
MKNIFILTLLFLTITSLNITTIHRESEKKNVIFLTKIENGLKINIEIDTLIGRIDFELSTQTKDTFYWESGIEISVQGNEPIFDELVLENHNPHTSVEFYVTLSPIFSGKKTNQTIYYFDNLKFFEANPKSIKKFLFSIKILKDFKDIEYIQRGELRQVRSETYKGNSFSLKLECKK